MAVVGQLRGSTQKEIVHPNRKNVDSEKSRLSGSIPPKASDDPPLWLIKWLSYIQSPVDHSSRLPKQLGTFGTATDIHRYQGLMGWPNLNSHLE